MSANKKEIIEKVNAAFEQNKMQDFYSLCKDDIEWQMAGGQTSKGLDAIRKFMSDMPADCGAPKINVTAIIADDTRAACYGDMTMKEKDVDTSYDYCDIYRFDGDKIASLTSFVVKTQTEDEGSQKAAA